MGFSGPMQIVGHEEILWLIKGYQKFVKKIFNGGKIS